MLTVLATTTSNVRTVSCAYSKIHEYENARGNVDGHSNDDGDDVDGDDDEEEEIDDKDLIDEDEDKVDDENLNDDDGDDDEKLDDEQLISKSKRQRNHSGTLSTRNISLLISSWL